MIPFIMYDALVSPGWTRADTTTPLREASASGSAVNDVIVSSSTVFPASVSQSGRRRKRLRVFGSSSSPLRYAPRSDIVYGWQYAR